MVSFHLRLLEKTSQSVVALDSIENQTAVIFSILGMYFVYNFVLNVSFVAHKNDLQSKC